MASETNMAFAGESEITEDGIRQQIEDWRGPFFEEGYSYEYELGMCCKVLAQEASHIITRVQTLAEAGEISGQVAYYLEHGKWPEEDEEQSQEPVQVAEWPETDECVRDGEIRPNCLECCVNSGCARGEHIVQERKKAGHCPRCGQGPWFLTRASHKDYEAGTNERYTYRICLICHHRWDESEHEVTKLEGDVWSSVRAGHRGGKING